MHKQTRLLTIGRKQHLGRMLGLLSILGALVPLDLYARHIDSLVRQANVAEILSLRCRPPKLVFTPPTYGLVVAGHGATIVITGDEVRGMHSLSAQRSLMSRRNDMGMPTDQIELRIIGRTIYFDREVETLELIDITGRKILTQYHVRHTSLGDIRSGVYIMRCTRSGRLSTTRLVLR